nr:hypothetical protein [Tanacetum cinerariifolium]
MHNNIMAAGSRDRPPMLVTGRYAQWRSWFLRYIDTRPNDDSPAVPEHTTVETPINMSPKNKAHYESEKEAIHLILTRIRDEIYSTVDACKTAQEMWEAIESQMHNNIMAAGSRDRPPMLVTRRYAQWRSWFLRYIDTRPNGDSLRKCILEGPYTPTTVVVPVLPATNDSPAVPEHTTLRKCGKLSKGYNKLNHSTFKINKEKEIAKSITPLSESDSEEDSDPEQAYRDKDMQKNLALIAKYFKKIYKPINNNLRTSSNSRNKNVDTTLSVLTARNLVILLRSAGSQKGLKTPRIIKKRCCCANKLRKGVPLQAEQSDLLANTNEEIDEQELEAHYSYMAKIQEVPTANLGTDSEPLEHVQYYDEYNVFANVNQHYEQSKSTSNTCLVEKDDSDVTPDSPDMVNHKTNVSRPHHRSTQMKEKVVPNNSQEKIKKTKVQDHPRIPSISNKTKTVTACNDSLNSRTSNVNAVCATCGKCLVDSNHFACVTKILKDVNARTKKPHVVPISTRKPKSQAKKY